MAEGRKRPFRHFKRSSDSAAAGSDELDAGDELVELRLANQSFESEREALFSPFSSKATYDMMQTGEKARLARDIWTADFSESLHELRRENPELVAVLAAQVANTTPDSETSLATKERLVDGMLVDICRAQNMHKMPLLTVGTSLLCEANKTSREYHDAISFYHRGAAASEKWVADFLPLANEARPAPAEPSIDGIAAVCFDNLTMKIDYSAYSSEGETGRMLDMTNWFSTRLPRHLAPNLNAEAICALASKTLPKSSPSHRPPFVSRLAVKAGPFRKDLSLRQFGLLFYSDHADLVSNKKARWGRFLRAARDGRLLERPSTLPLWSPHKIYHPPIPDVLQSSYAHVELELRTMCDEFLSQMIIFVAGDGLALMRLNHLLRNKPDVYIDQTPFVIPIQGARGARI